MNAGGECSLIPSGWNILILSSVDILRQSSRFISSVLFGGVEGLREEGVRMAEGEEEKVAVGEE